MYKGNEGEKKLLCVVPKWSIRAHGKTVPFIIPFEVHSVLKD